MFYQLSVSYFEPVFYSNLTNNPMVMFQRETHLNASFAVDFWIDLVMLSGLWWCLATSCAVVFDSVPNFASRVNQAESSTGFSLCLLFFFSCVCDPAITKPDLLGSDLLFFTSPTYQPTASAAAKRNEWYFRGELLFPFFFC